MVISRHIFKWRIDLLITLACGEFFSFLYFLPSNIHGCNFVLVQVFHGPSPWFLFST
jgi:hypothetical protein